MLNLGSMRFNQSKTSTLDKPTNGGLVLKYSLFETIHAQENGSRGIHFAKFLISNSYSGVVLKLFWFKSTRDKHHITVFKNFGTGLSWDPSQMITCHPQKIPRLLLNGGV